MNPEIDPAQFYTGLIAEQARFRALLAEAGFGRIACVLPLGGPAPEDALTFVFLAQRPL